MRAKSVVCFLAVVLTALAFVPAGAHLLQLSNKIALFQEQYFAVQSIYRGWAFFGFVLCGAITANFALAVAQRSQSRAFWFALLGFALTGTSLVIFLFWTYPTNQATTNFSRPLRGYAIDSDWLRLERSEVGASRSLCEPISKVLL